jgi:hypothetical protein
MAKPNSSLFVIRCEEKRPRYINSQEIPNWQQGPTISEAVNYLARNGWLLLSDHFALQLGHGDLIFIRPKQHLIILCEEKRPRYINGQEIPNWQHGPTVAEAVIYLSQKGWSLFSDFSALQLGDGKLTLIRPKQ